MAPTALWPTWKKLYSSVDTEFSLACSSHVLLASLPAHVAVAWAEAAVHVRPNLRRS